MIAGLFGNPFATSWTFIQCYLVFQLPYSLDKKGYRSPVVTFTKGQPLGFFCSWPLFKLTHHMLVWIAAERDEVTRDFSPVSAKMLRSLVGSVATPIFSKIRDVTGTMSLSLTYRLRGASYRICGAPYRPKSKRWKRNYLCMLSPSGVFPLPLKLWLAFPDLGVLTPGVARAFILDRVKPGYFNEKEIEGLRTFYPVQGEDFLDRLILQPWVKMWLKYLRWYAEVSVNYDVSLEVSRSSCCTNVYLPF